jgi:hypothetical protein
MLVGNNWISMEPLGNENFVMKLEWILDRMLKLQKTGRKPKGKKKRMDSEHGE